MKEENQKYLIFGISFGLISGIVFHNIALGLAMSFGCVLGLYLISKKKTKKHHD